MTKVIVKKARKVNIKDVAKLEVMEIFKGALIEAGLDFEDGAEFEMTKGTIVVHLEGCDVQIKPISPKAGLDRYQKVEYVDEVEA